MSDERETANTNGELSRSLRAFLAQARFDRVTAGLWHELQRKLECSISYEGVQNVRSTLQALQKEKGSVPCTEWSALKQRVGNLLHQHKRPELLQTLQKDGLSDNFEGSRKLNSNKRVACEDLKSRHPQKRAHRVDDVVVLSDDDETPVPHKMYVNTFYLLKSAANIENGMQTIALDDIITAGAELTVVCNYNFDVAWMWERAPGLQTSRKVLIVHGETEEEERGWMAFLEANNCLERVRFARPRTPPYGTVHSKMFLQFFPTGCRVCIHTANMVLGDWDYKTQGAYVRDFPIVDQTTARSGPIDRMELPNCQDDFKKQLDRYFRHALRGDIREEVVRAIARYDFSSAGVALVSSVPGVHKGSAMMHFGHARLRELLQQETFEHMDSRSVAVCQFSSLGSIQERWLESEFKETLFSEKKDLSSSRVADADSNEIKLVYPTVDQVNGSFEGRIAGASLPVRGRNLHRKHIMNKLHRWEGKCSGYERAMPHIKTVLRYPVSRPELPCWVFLGSFNLSVAAWGRMQGARKGKKSWDRLNVLAYEVGVLFTPGLACAPAHSVDASIKYVMLSSTETTLWRQAKRDGRVRIKVSSFKRLRSEEDSPAQNSDDAIVLLEAPIPYALPPKQYEITDIAWTIEHLMM